MSEQGEESALAQRVRIRLDALGLSARGASIAAGLGPDAIRTIFSGASREPRRSTILALAEVLRCTEEYLLDGADPPPALAAKDEWAGEVLRRRLRQRMQALGYNDYSLAVAAGVGESFVRDILSGKVQSPRVSGLAAICRELEVTVSWLIGEEDDSPYVRPQGAITLAQTGSGMWVATRETGAPIFIAHTELEAVCAMIPRAVAQAGV